MTAEELFRHAEPGIDYLVEQKPFACVGTLKATFDGGEVRRWIFDQEGNVLAVSLDDDEEGMIYRLLDEVVEFDGDVIRFRDQDFEFAYEDTGMFNEVDGDTEIGNNEPFSMTEYEAESSDVLRLVISESGHKMVYLGSTLPLKKITEAE